MSVRRPPAAVLALPALVVLGILEWPWTSGFSTHGAVCNVADRCALPDARDWLVGTRCVAACVVLLWTGSALRRTWTRGAGKGSIGSDVSLRVAAPLAAAGLVITAGWFGAGVALMSTFVGSWVAGVTILGLTLMGLIRGLERLFDSTLGYARPNFSAQLAWLAPLVGALAALTAYSVDGRKAATPSAALVVALVVVTCDASVRRGLRSLAVPLGLAGCSLLAAAVFIGPEVAAMRNLAHEAIDPFVLSTSSRPGARSQPDPSIPERLPTPTRPALPPAGVSATRECRPQDLTLTGGGWDSTMGKSSMTITARNTSTHACWLDGIPLIRITQGARDLDVTYEPGSAENIGQPGSPRRVGIPASGEAHIILWWPGYRTTADQTTPQHLSVAALPGYEVEVPLNPPPGATSAPFDLVDGGRVVVSAWSATR